MKNLEASHHEDHEPVSGCKNSELEIIKVYAVVFGYFQTCKQARIDADCHKQEYSAPTPCDKCVYVDHV